MGFSASKARAPRFNKGRPVRIGSSRASVKINPKAAATFKVEEAAAPQSAGEEAVDSESQASGAELVSNDSKKVSKAIAQPSPVMLATSNDDVLNNLLSREILDPSADTEPEDVSLQVMQDVVRAALSGKDLSELEERIRAVSAMMQDKHQLLQAIINGPHALHEKNEWVRLQARVNRELRKAAWRGDLKTSELLMLSQMSQEIIERIDRDLRQDSSGDPVSVVKRIENNRKRQDEAVAKRFENTTPQGREIIRKQAYRMSRDIKQHMASSKNRKGKSTA